MIITEIQNEGLVPVVTDSPIEKFHIPTPHGYTINGM